jgi:hypothetical protein
LNIIEGVFGALYREIRPGLQAGGWQQAVFEACSQNVCGLLIELSADCGGAPELSYLSNLFPPSPPPESKGQGATLI